MNYVIWNMDKDQFWSDGNVNEAKGHWTNRYYCTKYTLEEIESRRWFFKDGDTVVALIALAGF